MKSAVIASFIIAGVMNFDCIFAVGQFCLKLPIIDIQEVMGLTLIGMY